MGYAIRKEYGKSMERIWDNGTWSEREREREKD